MRPIIFAGIGGIAAVAIGLVVAVSGMISTPTIRHLEPASEPQNGNPLVPSVSLTMNFANVAEGHTLSGSYDVIVNSSDPDNTTNIKLYVDSTFILQENTAPYEFSVNTTSFAEGGHVLKAVATDDSGNVVEKTISVIFDHDGSSPPVQPSANLPSAESVFNTATFDVPHYVSHFILINPTHSHHKGVDARISPTNSLYLPTNLVISQSTAVTLLVWDDHGIHQMKATRADNGATEWTTPVLMDGQASPPHLFSAATNYNTQDIYPKSTTYDYDQSHIKGTITIGTSSETPDGTIVGAMYVPQTFDRTNITDKGLAIESEYDFHHVWKHLPYENTLIIFSSKQSLADTLKDLQAIIAEVNYD